MQPNKLRHRPFANWLNADHTAASKALQEAEKKLEQYRATVRVASAEIEYRNRVIRALTAFTYQASRLTNAADLLDLALGQALKTATAHMGGIILIDPTTNNLTMGTYRGLTPDLVRILTGRQFDEGAAVLMPHLVSGKGALVEVGDAMATDERQLLQAADVASLVSLPLQAGYQLLGAMVIGSKGSFTPADVHCLIAIAQETAVALEALDLREKLWNTAESLLKLGSDQDEIGPTGFTNPLTIPPLTLKFAECVLELGGSMGALFIIGDEEDGEDRKVFMAADYGLSPLTTSQYARFRTSEELFPFDKLVARNLLVKDIAISKTARQIPLLHSLEEEGARSVLAILLDDGDHPDTAVVIAAPASDQLTPDDVDKVIPKIRRLLPYLTDEHLPAVSLPISPASHTTNEAAVERADMERLLTAVISAEDAVEQRQADLVALNKIGTYLTQTSDLTEAIPHLTVLLQETLPAEAVWLYVADKTGELHLLSHVGLSPEYAAQFAHLAPDKKSIEGAISRHNRPFFGEDLWQYLPATHPLMAQEQIFALAMLPLNAPASNGRSPQRVGVLSAGMAEVHHWQPRQIQLLTAVAHQISLALHADQLQQQLSSGLQVLAHSNHALAEIGQILATLQLNGTH